MSTLTELVNELTHQRLVAEMDPIPRVGAGRRTRLLRLDDSTWGSLGVEVAAGSVSTCLMDLSGTVISETRQPVEGAARLPDRLAAAADIVHELSDTASGTSKTRGPTTRGKTTGALRMGGLAVTAVVVAVPGELVRASGRAGRQEIADKFRDEIARRATADTNVVVRSAGSRELVALQLVRTQQVAVKSGSMIVCLGGDAALDAGLLVNGTPFPGAGGRAGDLAHAPTGMNGPMACSDCRQSNCLNAVAGLASLLVGTGLRTTRSAARMSRTAPADGVRFLLEGADQHRRVRTVLARAGDAVASAITTTSHLLDPEAVVLDGYLPPLQHRLGLTGDRFSRHIASKLITAADSKATPAAGAALAARDIYLDEPHQLNAFDSPR